MPFLENVTRGRGVPRERLLDVAHHYELFGGVSPINEQNRALIAALETGAARARDRPAGLLRQPQLASVHRRCDGRDARRRRPECARVPHLGVQLVLGLPAVPREPLRRAAGDRARCAGGVAAAHALQPPGVRRGERGSRARCARRGAGSVRTSRSPRIRSRLRWRATAPTKRSFARPRGSSPRRSASSTGRSCTSRAAGRRRCRGSSRTSPTISSRSTARARRAWSSRRSASSPTTSKCCMTWTSRRAKPPSDSACRSLVLRARARTRRSSPRSARRSTNGSRPATPKRALGRLGPSWDTCAPDCCRPATAGLRPGTVMPVAWAEVSPAALNARRSRRARAISSTPCAAWAACRPSSSRRPSSSSPRASTESCSRRSRGALGAARARQGVDAARDAASPPGGGAAAVARRAARGRRRGEGLPEWRDPNGHDPSGARRGAGRRGPCAVRDVLDGRCLLREEIVDEVVARVGPEPRARLSSGFAFFLGDLCQGPPRGAKVTFVRPDQWIDGWTEPDEAEALREACRRFLHAYGPARPPDFLEWFGGGRLNAADGRALFETLELEEVDVEGRRGVRARRRHVVPGVGAERAAAARVRRVRDGLPRARRARASASARAGRDARRAGATKDRPACVSCSSTASTAGLLGAERSEARASRCTSRRCGGSDVVAARRAPGRGRAPRRVPRPGARPDDRVSCSPARARGAARAAQEERGLRPARHPPVRRARAGASAPARAARGSPSRRR